MQNQEGVVRPRVYTCWDELADFSEPWEQLLRHSIGPTIFSTPEWLGAWWKAFGQGKQLITLALWNSTGDLVGLAPLYLEELGTRFHRGIRRLRLVGDGSSDSDNLDLIFRVGWEEPCSQALLTWLASEPAWDVCELNTLPEDSPNTCLILKGVKQRGWVHVLHERPNSAVALPDRWDSYLQQLPKEHAHGIERHTRRLARHYAVCISKCREENELSSCLDVLYDLHQRRWNSRGKPGTFASPEGRQFYAEMSRGFLRRGWLEFWFLELDGNIVAAQFAFRYGDTVYQLQEGLDPAHYSDRAGQVLRAHILQQLIAEGVRRYDYLGGIAPHKQSWGAQAGSYTDIRFAEPLTRAGLYMGWKPRIEAGRQWLRAHAPSPAYALLRAIYHGVQGC
jgi:CelD/BcsL family acetyltransferase involved in cellulose biosynthesis